MYTKFFVTQVEDWSYERRVELQFAHLHSSPELYFQLATCYPCRSCCSRIEQVRELCKEQNIPVEEDFRGNTVYLKFVLEQQEKLGLITFSPAEIAQFISELIELRVVSLSKSFKQESFKSENNEEDLRLWSKIRWLEKVEEFQTSLLYQNINLYEKYGGNLQALLAFVILACGNIAVAFEELVNFDSLSESQRALSFDQGRLVKETLGDSNPALNSYLQYKAIPKITILWVRNAMRESGLWRD